MAYTTIDDSGLFFNTVLYTGNNSTQSITGVGFQPDWLWIKNRGADANHDIVNSVIGSTKIMHANTNSAEGTDSNGVTSFDSDGFSLGNRANTNANNGTMVSWNWKAPTAFSNDASSTGIGTIDSAGNASATSGFSIVAYTGTGTAGTIKHGLSSTPRMIIAKSRNAEGVWLIYHKDIPIKAQLQLQSTDGYYEHSGNIYWNGTHPTTSVFSVGTSGAINPNGTNFVAYCFADVKGYSRIGSYKGNGNANGPFIYTGFKPAFLLVKKSTANGTDWNLHDNRRPGFNVNNSYLASNTSAAEVTGNTYQIFDLCSNGFKCRGTGTGTNDSGETMIYMAFAENPFVNSEGVPSNGR